MPESRAAELLGLAREETHPLFDVFLLSGLYTDRFGYVAQIDPLKLKPGNINQALYLLAYFPRLLPHYHVKKLQNINL